MCDNTYMPTPIGRTSPTIPATTPATSYTVQPGDNLSKIASRNGTTTAALVAANQGKYPNIADPKKLQAGWKLNIPNGTTAAPAAPGTSGAPTTPSAPPTWAPKSNDQVLFVAMNNSDAHRSTLESDALKARGTNVKVIQDSQVADSITTKDASGTSKTHDLTTQDGATSFALTLGLPAEQTKKVADVIMGAGSDAKDEIAQIAQEWSKAERGGQIASRLILSGHHVGGGVYGENNGKLDWPTVGKLAEAMPRASRSVEDLMIAGCYSGGPDFMDKYKAMFPNAKTIVAYSGSSPGASSGATAHQKAWESATRGERQTIDRKIFDGMRKGENVTVWTQAHGFQDGNPPRTVDSIREGMANQKPSYDAAFTGDVAIDNPQQGPVRSYYNELQRMIQHPDTSAAERLSTEAQRDQTIRLLFYGPVSKRFAEVNDSKIATAFAALNLPKPDFKTMTRKEAFTAITNFETAMASNANPPSEASRFAQTLSDFKALKPNVIPDTWI
jgi:murein DD-endopeptidase MepM/ murein hydrolase activator NlpD